MNHQRPFSPSIELSSTLPSKPSHIETIQESISTGRRVWVGFCWFCTWWIPAWTLVSIGGMKRPDVQQAWREKVVLCFLIALLSVVIIFYIVFFGKLLCPQFDRVWNIQEVAEHQGDNDFWVTMLGNVYDMSDFWQTQHSDVPQYIQTTRDNMSPFGGKDVTDLFPVPLNWGCAGLVGNELFLLDPNNTVEDPTAVHKTGAQSQWVTSAMHRDDWYWGKFLVKMESYRKGDLVWAPEEITKQYIENQRKWVIYGQQIFDLTNYFHNADDLHPGTNSPGSVAAGVPNYHFLDPDIEQIIRDNFAKDITSKIDALNSSVKYSNLYCLNRAFYAGILDFRLTPRCQANNYLMLVFSIILMAVNVVKFMAALRYTKSGRPEPMDKFVICQVPCYTEGEDSIRKTVNSLTALEYDDKAKLLFIICDGMVVGSGNDRPTPRIVLDVLGVDPKLDPEPLMFKAVGEGSKQLNYGKVYSGLYEFEGHVVPYIVVVKVGKPSERTRPGNRGKRDSQIILLQYLNRIHFDSEMCPLELEICHHQRNVIGIDPSLYEYILMVDADTEVASDALNRLVADSSDDGKIIGICGETSISNDERSVWTMIQVYEYYISHHLTKSFEALFGTVTCLPGCFCMYRVRTPDDGRPLIISSRVIEEYSVGNVDTLHKKNLLSLGEDRYLTTLMMKHFPLSRLTFNPHAMAKTAAPESLFVLLSQRRRWINSTVHNLAELAFLPELCGFCCFSMRFVVIIDLLGTLILPATVGYLIYLIVMLTTRQSIFPLISIIMLAAIYGLQALIFIFKLQWQHVGWMIIYLLSFPFYSLFIPIYSFWHFDDFSWGNTRVVIGEKGNTKMILTNEDDETFDESIIPLRRWSDYEQDMWEDEGSQMSYTTVTDHTCATGQTGYTGYTDYSGPRCQARRPSPWTDSRLHVRRPPCMPSMPFGGSVYNEPGHGYRAASRGSSSVYSVQSPSSPSPYIPPIQQMSPVHSPRSVHGGGSRQGSMYSPSVAYPPLMDPRAQTPPIHYSPYLSATQPVEHESGYASANPYANYRGSANMQQGSNSHHWLQGQ